MMGQPLLDLLPKKVALALWRELQIETLEELIEFSESGGLWVKMQRGEFRIVGFLHTAPGVRNLGDHGFTQIQQLFDAHWPKWKMHAYISGAHFRNHKPIGAKPGVN